MSPWLLLFLFIPVFTGVWWLDTRRRSRDDDSK